MQTEAISSSVGFRTCRLGMRTRAGGEPLLGGDCKSGVAPDESTGNKRSLAGGTCKLSAMLRTRMTIGVTVIATEGQVGGAPREGARGATGAGGGSTAEEMIEETPDWASLEETEGTDSDGGDGSANETRLRRRQADESERIAGLRAGGCCAEGAEDEPGESEGRAEGRTEGRDDLIHLGWIDGRAIRVPTAGVTTAGAGCQYPARLPLPLPLLLPCELRGALSLDGLAVPVHGEGWLEP